MLLLLTSMVPCTAVVHSQPPAWKKLEKAWRESILPLWPSLDAQACQNHSPLQEADVKNVFLAATIICFLVNENISTFPPNPPFSSTVIVFCSLIIFIHTWLVNYLRGNYNFQWNSKGLIDCMPSTPNPKKKEKQVIVLFCIVLYFFF